jgi:uncharacterized protein YndB with AHSA1/START domain
VDRPQTARHVATDIVIHAPIERVFAYATTPGHWPEWHPASLAVAGAVDHPLAPGERVTEDVRVAGWRGRVIWTARTYEPPHRWVLDGIWEGLGCGILSYTLSPWESGDATYFEREFDYTPPTAWLRLLDHLVVRRRIAAESVVALRRLRTLMEAPPADAT